jgi:hypothetical protein
VLDRHTFASPPVCPPVCPTAVQERSFGSQRHQRSKKNGPEIVNFRPVLESPLALANRRLRPLGHLTADFQVHETETLTRNARQRRAESDRRSKRRP